MFEKLKWWAGTLWAMLRSSHKDFRLHLYLKVMNHPASISGLRAFYSKDKLGSLLCMIKPVSQGLGYVPPVTSTANGSVLPAPGNGNHALVSKVAMTTLLRLSCYGLPAAMSLFQEVFISNLLCFILLLPIRLPKSPTPSYENSYLSHVQC